MHVPHSHPAQGAASRKQQGGSGLEAGIQWPSPDESPPFWERPARTAPAPLRSGGPARLLMACPVLSCWTSAQPLAQRDVVLTSFNSATAGSSQSPQYTQVQDPLQIFHMTAEMAPLAKVKHNLGHTLGGLSPVPSCVGKPGHTEQAPSAAGCRHAGLWLPAIVKHTGGRQRS